MLEEQSPFDDPYARQETFVLTLFRLFKLATMHDLNNQAIGRGLSHAAQTFSEIFARESTDLSALFTSENVFINGQPLKASRNTYESVLELGRLLERTGFNELRLGRSVSRDDLSQMLEHFTLFRKDPPGNRSVQLTRNVRFKHVDPTFILGENEGELTIEERVARIYTSALVIMRRALEALAEGEYRLMNTIKRVAQSMVMIADQDPGALLSALGQRPDRDDPATVAVHTAVLSTVMARSLSRDLTTLSDITTSSLMVHAGEQRLRALNRIEDDPFGDALPAALTSSDQKRVPVSTSAVTALMSGLYLRSQRRMLMSYEAQWLEREDELGPLYRGKLPPSLSAVIIAKSFRFQQLLAFDIAAQRPRTPDETLAILVQESATAADKLVLKLLCTTLGLYPKGTQLQLSSGAQAVVASNHELPVLYDRPLVYLVSGPGGVYLQPRFVDLASLDPDIVRLGNPLKVLNYTEGTLAKAAQIITSGQLEIPQVKPPELGKIKLEEFAAPSSGPSPGVHMLTSQGARKARLGSILDSVNSAIKYTSPNGEYDKDLFND